MTVTLMRGDCLDVMATLAENSVDTIITDPPYALTANKNGGTGEASLNLDSPAGRSRVTTGGGFMGKEWDGAIPGIPFWAAALRVAKPGATLMAFGGTRTHHRLMCAIEDAGWELRDTMMWVYGSGFPKSHDISKAIDKAAGAERDYLGEGQYSSRKPREYNGGNSLMISKHDPRLGHPITAPATDAAQLWDGWGTALKPAWEPIIIAQKPNDGTFANNALTWGVAGLNIDGGRVGTNGNDPNVRRATGENGGADSVFGVGNSTRPATLTQGRWPANLVHDGSDEVISCFPSNGRSTKPSRTGTAFKNDGMFMPGQGRQPLVHNDNGGSAARFFYCAKASRAERNAGCEGMEEKERAGINKMMGNDAGGVSMLTGSGNIRNNRLQNNHPTVKPLALMRYLAKLTRTPTGGVVLDPFMGSGTTGMAAVYEGRDFIGIELEPEYFEIATARIQHAIDEQEHAQTEMGL